MGEDRRGQVHAVRLPRRIADKLNEAAVRVGGYGEAIEAMATAQELARDWFREYLGDVRGPDDVRITFRLSARAEGALRAWAGRRPLSKVIRHLVLYTVTDGRRATLVAAAVDTPAPAARPAASKPAPSPARLPTAPSVSLAAARPAPSYAPPPTPLTAVEAFNHLPPSRQGLRYVCEIPGCEFGAGPGAVVRCRKHVTWVAPAFGHLPALPMGQRYICQVTSCRFTQGDGVSTGIIVVPVYCCEHA